METASAYNVCVKTSLIVVSLVLCVCVWTVFEMQNREKKDMSSRTGTPLLYCY